MVCDAHGKESENGKTEGMRPVCESRSIVLSFIRNNEYLLGPR